MIDAERMLGSLVRNAMGGKRGRRGRRRRKATSMLSGGAKTGLAMGALGVAFGLYEHLSKQQGGSGSSWDAGRAPQDPTTTPTPPSSSPTPDLPPLPVTATPDLPPLPTASAAPPPSGAPAEPPPGSQPSADPAEALLLVRAMIAAANADHEVDDDERDRILRSLEESGLGEEEKQFVLAELESPTAPAALAAEAKTPELASQIYLASLMAIEIDSSAEEAYMKRLAQELGLDEVRVAELDRLLAEGSN